MIFIGMQQVNCLNFHSIEGDKPKKALERVELSFKRPTCSKDGLVGSWVRYMFKIDILDIIRRFKFCK